MEACHFYNRQFLTEVFFTWDKRVMLFNYFLIIINYPANLPKPPVGKTLATFHFKYLQMNIQIHTSLCVSLWFIPRVTLGH